MPLLTVQFRRAVSIRPQGDPSKVLGFNDLERLSDPLHVCPPNENAKYLSFVAVDRLNEGVIRRSEGSGKVSITRGD